MTMVDSQTTSQTLDASVLTLEAIPEAQPKGLYLLFFTELWERFGFYTLQTIIILYMTKALLMGDVKANLLYAAFSSLLYLTPTIGGYLADRYLGFQRAIMIGGLMFIIGYLVCSSENQDVFFLGLSILICANGFFKPNVSSIVGELYKENDPRRDGGFTLFYMGINIGALIPPLIAGALVIKYGWHAGFFLAAAGMAIGQFIFQLGRKQLGDAGKHPQIAPTTSLSYPFYTILFAGIIIAVLLCQQAFKYPATTNYAVEIATAFVVAVVIFYLAKEPPKQRKKLFAALILIAISVAFWTLYNQAFTSLMLFADRNMDRHFLSFPFDAEATQFFNPFFLILLSPLLSRVWLRMDRVGLNPSTQFKFFMGMLFTSASFLMLAFTTKFLGNHGMISPWWICISYLLQTIGELMISPIGLAMITVLCPKHLVGLMMGVWFFAQAASFAIGGFLANLAAIPENLAAASSLPIYSHAFLIYGLIALATTFFSLCCLPLLNKLVKE